MKLNNTFTTIEMDDGTLLKFYEKDIRRFQQANGDFLFVVKVFSMQDKAVGVLNMDAQRRFTSLYLYDGAAQPHYTWEPIISLDVNNGRKLVLTYERGHTVVTCVKPDGDVDYFYHISDGDFVSMLNWYQHQKQIGNSNLLF